MDGGIISDWRWIVEYLRDVGLSPAGIALVLMVSSMMYRSWRREQTLEQRQEVLHKRIDAEISRLSAEHERCMEHLSKVEIANIHLDRWKAICEDACPLSETIHKRAAKWNGSN